MRTHELFAAHCASFLSPPVSGEGGAKACTCPTSAWIGSEPNDSTCALSEEEHEALKPSPSLPEQVSEAAYRELSVSCRMCGSCIGEKCVSVLTLDHEPVVYLDGFHSERTDDAKDYGVPTPATATEGEATQLKIADDPICGAIRSALVEAAKESAQRRGLDRPDINCVYSGAINLLLQDRRPSPNPHEGERSEGWSTSAKPIDIAAHPLIRKSYEITQAIDRCGASEEMTRAAIVSSELTSALSAMLTDDSYVAWMRWIGHPEHRHLSLCNSDSEGAFRVYRHPDTYSKNTGDTQ